MAAEVLGAPRERVAVGDGRVVGGSTVGSVACRHPLPLHPGRCCSQARCRCGQSDQTIARPRSGNGRRRCTAGQGRDGDNGGPSGPCLWGMPVNLSLQRIREGGVSVRALARLSGEQHHALAGDGGAQVTLPSAAG